nr:hypothetical protein BdHM001_35540 [Bdellovibrio sp. HM001]
MKKAILQDIKKLRDFAKSLGVRVIIRRKTSDDAGTYDYDSKLVTINIQKKWSQKDIVKALIHEVAHAHGDKLFGRDHVFKKAFKHAGEDCRTMPAETRRAIYQLEKRDIERMHSIWKMLDLKSVSEKEVIDDALFDLTVYEYYADASRHLSKRRRSQLKRAIREGKRLQLVRILYKKM